MAKIGKPKRAGAKAIKKKAGQKGPAKKTAAKKTRKKPPKARAKTMATEASAPPPYICVHTPQTGTCLKFMYNPTTGRHDIPPGGIRVDCSECEYF